MWDRPCRRCQSNSRPSSAFRSRAVRSTCGAPTTDGRCGLGVRAAAGRESPSATSGAPGGASWSRCAKNRLYRCQKTIGSSSTTSFTERCTARFPMDTTSCAPIRIRSTARLKTSSPYHTGSWLASTPPTRLTGTMPNRSGNAWRFVSSRRASTRPSCRCRGYVASVARHSCRIRAKVPTTRTVTERRARNAERRVSRHTASALQS